MCLIKKKKQKRELIEDCWSLDYAFTTWLEPRLRMYLKDAGQFVDLNYHTYIIDGEDKTQEEWIREMIKLCEYVNNEDNFVKSERYYKQKRLGKIWAELMPVMWW